MNKDITLVLTKDKTPHEINLGCIAHLVIDLENGIVEVIKKKNRKLIETYPSKNMRLLIDGISHKL